MSYYYSCQVCGANLDPGESCDCGDSKETTKIISPNERKEEPECKTLPQKPTSLNCAS